jgi:hypothetical protein
MLLEDLSVLTAKRIKVAVFNLSTCLSTSGILQLPLDLGLDRSYLSNHIAEVELALDLLSKQFEFSFLGWVVFPVASSCWWITDPTEFTLVVRSKLHAITIIHFPMDIIVKRFSQPIIHAAFSSFLSLSSEVLPELCVEPAILSLVTDFLIVRPTLVELEVGLLFVSLLLNRA